ncbi:MAG TPA: hypothetical protein PKC69_13340 [Chitinophagaceae bacterium]|nr:hypothetical protein [Chitinophagaceae bacterium]
MPVIPSRLSEQGFGFAVFPDVLIYDEPGGKTIQHLLFGDYITPPKKPSGNSYKKWTSQLAKTVNGKDWLQVRSRQEEGWILLNEIQTERTLEVNFVDIGQGDGCHLVTPADEHFIIDAGEGDNMYRFLRWRFNLARPGGKLPKFYAMISHPDQDHWKGFEWLLSKPPANQNRRISFSKLYHNGIVQRSGNRIGDIADAGNEKYLTDFLLLQQEVTAVLEQEGSKSNYEKFLTGALANFPGLEIETVYNGFSDTNILYSDEKLELEILAPVPEDINGQLMLRWFDATRSEIAKTKNGHSIVLVAKIGKMKVLLGGDLNSRSADYLMEHYSGQDVRLLRAQMDNATPQALPAFQKKMQEIIDTCRNYFQSEVAKSCHHGSHDITNELLAAINPIATVISSGDEESHCHPRPETLGAIGKYGRGERPLIFSTELARSSPEYIQLKAAANPTDKTKQRVVSTYGMITLRTDGEKAIIAQKLEKSRSSFGKLVKWHIDKIIWNDERGEFISKK